MLDIFKARLKAKTKAAGVNLSQKRIDAYADRLSRKNPDITDEAEHDKLIDALDEMVSFADVAKEDDRIRTLEAKSKNQIPPKPDEQDEEEEPEEGKTTKPKDRTPKWAKDLMSEVQSLRAEKVQGTIRSKVTERLKGKVPEKFYSKWALPEKEDELENFITTVEKDWTEFKQEQVNAGLMTATPPAGGNGSASTNAGVIDKKIEAWAEKNKKKTEAIKQTQK